MNLPYGESCLAVGVKPVSMDTGSARSSGRLSSSEIKSSFVKCKQWITVMILKFRTESTDHEQTM